MHLFSKNALTFIKCGSKDIYNVTKDYAVVFNFLIYSSDFIFEDSLTFKKIFYNISQ